MDVRSFKLSDGSELVAELVRISKTGEHVIKRPLLVAPMRGADGQPHIGFGFWSMIVDTDHEIMLLPHALLTAPAKVIEQVATSYMQQVTGIALPSASSGQILQG